jgi:microcystin-dependent protein
MWGTSMPPSGYLLCDGSDVSRILYSDLFGVIGTTFGAGDGAQLSMTSGSGTGSYYTLVMPSNNFIIAVGDSFTFSGTGSGFFDGLPFVAVAPTTSFVISFASAFTANVPNIASALVFRTAAPTTFTLPDFDDRVPRGVDNANTYLASTGGADTTTFTIDADNLPQHRHGYNLAAGGGFASADGSNGNRAAQTQNYTNSGQTYPDGTLVPTPNTAITTSTKNKYLGIYYIIHYA